MTSRKAVLDGLFIGMGFICGGGWRYIDRIVYQDDAEALKSDLEAVGRDMYKVMGKVDKSLQSPRVKKRESQNG